VGSGLVGSHALVAGARRWRKVTGGGMRQAGILAAAGLHALDHHVARLADDHARAARLADALRDVAGVAAVAQHTNMVFVEVARERLSQLHAAMETRRVRLSIGDAPQLRLVLHLDVDDAGVQRVVEGFRAFAGNA
jgi:threonine aldolase